jgi:S-formylglutathione hydrolase FrmB
MNLKRLIIPAVAAVISLGAQAFKTDTITIKSDLLPNAMKVTVITPDNAVKGETPSVYLLNGYGGDYRSWGIIRPDMGQIADCYNMVMVMPSGMDSWYWDAPANPSMKMESFFVRELVPYIDNHYPTAQDASLRAITGLSMGGHGALWLALRHPDIWHNAGSTSGGVNIIPFPKKWKMAAALGDYEANKQRWEDHTVINLVDSLTADQAMNIIFDCGTEDFFSDVNLQLHNKLLKMKIPHDYIARPGVHNAKYWANSILYQLLYFDSKFSK